MLSETVWVRKNRGEEACQEDATMPKSFAAAQGRRHPLLALTHGRRRAGLSDQAGAHHRSVPAGRASTTPSGAWSRNAPQQPAGQAVRRRQPRRRRRRGRHRAGRQCTEGRPHAAGRVARHHRQSLALHPAATITTKPSRRWRSVATAPNVIVGPSGPAGQVGERSHRAGEEAAGQAAIRLVPASAPSCISGRSCSSSWPASTSCTCRSKARRRR